MNSENTKQKANLMQSASTSCVSTKVSTTFIWALYGAEMVRVHRGLFWCGMAAFHFKVHMCPFQGIHVWMLKHTCNNDT